MLPYAHLCGQPYNPGRQDCFSIVRGFLNPHLPTPIPNFARPTDFVDNNLDLFGHLFTKAGFQLFDGHSADYQIGDVFLHAVLAPRASHCSVLVEPNLILHHYVGQLSVAEPMPSSLRNRIVGVLRHKDFSYQPEETPIHVG